MAPQKQSPLGEKIDYWLVAQRRARRDPHTPTALARDLGVDQKTVVGWISNGNLPRIDNARHLAEIMGVPLWWLAADTEPPEPRPTPTDLDALLIGLSPEERRLVLSALQDPRAIRVLLALGQEGD